MATPTITGTVAGLEYLCFECPQCHNERVQIDFIRGDYNITCRLCKATFHSWFNGEMWLNELISHW